MKLKNLEGSVLRRISDSAHYNKQILATVAAALFALCGGINMGFTAVLLPQLENDTTFPYDKEYDSWIASFTPLAMTVGSLFAGSLSDWIGRKMSQIVLCVPFVIGWIIMGLSTSNTMLLIARFITGMCFGALRPSGMVFIAELADPKYRATLLVCPALTLHTGYLVSHTVGKYVYWKYSCYVFAIPSVISLIILMFLKESPLWLLNDGKVEEGIESFRLYRGNKERSEKELTIALELCKEKANKVSFKDNKNILCSKLFAKTLLSTFLLFIAVQWCGVNILPYYAEYMFQKTFSGDVDAFLLMIVSDCIRILASTSVCIGATFFPRRLTLLICCYITCLLLAAISLYLYLQPTGYLWIALACITIYIATGTALTSISFSILPELFPAKVRGFGSGLGTAISFILIFISVKVTPGIINNFGLITLWSIFAISTLVSGTCLIFLLPDTHGRTLHDIEDSLYKKKQHIESDCIQIPTVRGS